MKIAKCPGFYHPLTTNSWLALRNGFGTLLQAFDLSSPPPKHSWLTMGAPTIGWDF